MIKKSIFIFSLLMATSVVVAADAVQQDVVKPIVLEATQVFNIYSKTNQQDYRIQVRLPSSYAANLEKKYPVIIKVDGQWDFPLASSVYNCIYFDGQMPEAIVIGVDWENVTGNVHAIRARDLLPAPMSQFEGSGNAKKFISVLADEIIPALNQRLRLNGEEFLLGGSWGATFTTFALLERPDVFEGAIAIAGDYKTASTVFDQQLKSLANSNALRGKRLYIGVGAGDMVAAEVTAYARKLKAANLRGIKFKFEKLEGYGHSGMNVPGYSGGYKHIFDRPQVAVAYKTLANLVGTYVADDKKSADLIIQIESKKLTASIGEDKIQLLAKTERDFFNPNRFFNITFDGEAAKVETFFGEVVYKRIASKN